MNIKINGEWIDFNNILKSPEAYLDQNAKLSVSTIMLIHNLAGKATATTNDKDYKQSFEFEDQYGKGVLHGCWFQAISTLGITMHFDTYVYDECSAAMTHSQFVDVLKEICLEIESINRIYDVEAIVKEPEDSIQQVKEKMLIRKLAVNQEALKYKSLTWFNARFIHNEKLMS